MNAEGKTAVARGILLLVPIGLGVMLTRAATDAWGVWGGLGFLGGVAFFALLLWSVENMDGAK